MSIQVADLKGVSKNSMMNSKRLNEVSRSMLMEEFEKVEYSSRGNIIAIGYLKGKVIDLLTDVFNYDLNIRACITRGILETLVMNISLPCNSERRHYNRKAIKGILLLKDDQVSVKKVLDDIDKLSADYEVAVQQAYTQFKKEFEIQLEEKRKVLEQQLGATVKLEIAKQSQFREKWRNLRAELSANYERTLESYRQHLLSVV